MKLEYILFLIYIFIIFWLWPRVAFIKRTGLSIQKIRFLLAFKILTGFLCAYYFTHFVNGMDYIGNNNEGIIQYQLLVTDPALFFNDYKSDLNKYGTDGLLDTSNSFWGYFRFYILYKYLAFQNLITQGNFYLNAAVFSSVIFWGHLAFFRIFYNIYQKNRDLILAVVFVLPSVLLFTSVQHKDGLVFLFVAFASLAFYGVLNTDKITFKNIVVFLLCLSGIFLLRNFVLFAILPAMVVAFAAKKINYMPVAVSVVLYTVFISFFFATSAINNNLSLPAAVVKRKADFALLENGNTDLPMNVLEPNAISFLKNIPQALNHVLLRPYPFEFDLATTLASLELYAYLLVFIIFCIGFRSAFKLPFHPFNIYGLAFCLSMIFIIGFTIPNAGAIVRYRSIIWIFLLSPIAGNITRRSQFK